MEAETGEYSESGDDDLQIVIYISPPPARPLSLTLALTLAPSLAPTLAPTPTLAHQITAYKSGTCWLSRRVSLVTFAEGTRSRDGRFQDFKRGAFKMAQATETPIVPMTICYSYAAHPIDFVFPVRPGRR